MPYMKPQTKKERGTAKEETCPERSVGKLLVGLVGVWGGDWGGLNQYYSREATQDVSL